MNITIETGHPCHGRRKPQPGSFGTRISDAIRKLPVATGCESDRSLVIKPIGKMHATQAATLRAAKNIGIRVTTWKQLDGTLRVWSRGPLTQST